MRRALPAAHGTIVVVSNQYKEGEHMHGDVQASLQPRSRASHDGPNRKSHRMQSCRATSKIPTPKETFRRIGPVHNKAIALPKRQASCSRLYAICINIRGQLQINRTASAAKSPHPHSQNYLNRKSKIPRYNSLVSREKDKIAAFQWNELWKRLFQGSKMIFQLGW